MITMYLVRHGQTEENLKRIFQGHLPGVLTDEGKVQAVELGKKLEGVHLDAVVSSDLKRVIDTVSLAVKERNLPWERTPLLREIDWGSWTGLYVSSVDTSCPPTDVESKEMLYERAGRFLSYLKQNYRNKTVLVVAHGLINRSVQAQIEGVKADKLWEVPHMKNAEVRRFELDDAV